MDFLNTKNSAIFPVSNFFMSFIIAFSYKKFYSIITTNKTFNSNIFLYFMATLIESKESIIWTHHLIIHLFETTDSLIRHQNLITLWIKAKPQ